MLIRETSLIIPTLRDIVGHTVVPAALVIRTERETYRSALSKVKRGICVVGGMTTASARNFYERACSASLLTWSKQRAAIAFT